MEKFYNAGANRDRSEMIDNPQPNRSEELRQRARDEHERAILRSEELLRKRLQAIEEIDALEADTAAPDEHGWHPGDQPSLVGAVREVLIRLSGDFDIATVREAFRTRFPFLYGSVDAGTLSTTIRRIVDETNGVQILRKGRGRTPTTYRRKPP